MLRSFAHCWGIHGREESCTQKKRLQITSNSQSTISSSTCHIISLSNQTPQSRRRFVVRQVRKQLLDICRTRLTRRRRRRLLLRRPGTRRHRRAPIRRAQKRMSLLLVRRRSVRRGLAHLAEQPRYIRREARRPGTLLRVDTGHDACEIRVLVLLLRWRSGAARCAERRHDARDVC